MYKNIDFIKTLPVLNNKGQLIKLSEMVTIVKQPSRADIKHVNAKRTTTILANTDRSIVYPNSVIEDVKSQFKSNDVVDITYEGESKESSKIFEDLVIALGVAIIGVYLIIALVFNSYFKPFIIMSIIPFCMVGVIYAMFAHGMPMSMFAGLAMVGLMGVIVNDSIVMVSTITDIHKASGGFTIRGLIKGASLRLRAVLLTTLTTVVAMFPTAYGLGGYDPMFSQMCLGMVYGLIFGTLILLVLLPCIYMVGNDIRVFWHNKRRKSQTCS